VADWPKDRARRAELRARGSGQPLRLTLPLDDIVAAYRAGESVNAIAARYRVSRRAIHIRLEVCGVLARSREEASRLANDATGRAKRHGRRRTEAPPTSPE
jgi:uncharacterized protein (DUF433 family)